MINTPYTLEFKFTKIPHPRPTCLSRHCALFYQHPRLVIVCITYRHQNEYFIVPWAYDRAQEPPTMTAPSNLVSLRITEDDLMMLDARVGLDGARNGSDVIREAIQQFLNGQPLVQGMDSVRIPLGHGDKKSLGILYELQGTTPEIATQEGLSLYIASATKALAQRNDQLEDLLADAKESTMRHKEYHE